MNTRACVQAMAILLGLGVASAAQASAQETEVRTFAITGQPLSSALLKFAEQTGLELLFDARIAAGKTSPGVQGDHAPEQALRLLLAETGLRYRFTSAGVITLEADTTEQNSGPLRLEPIVVEGEKIGRTLRETPASTVVIGPEADTPLSRNSRDAIQGIPNVLVEDNANVPSIRGIDGSAGQTGGAALSTGAQPRVNIIVDGVPRPLTIGATPTINSTWDLEAIEVARGPQSTTTGRNSLGGAIRVSTIDPSFDYEAAARGSYFDQDGTVGGALMANLPILEDQIAARFTAERSHGKTYVNVVEPAVAAVRDDIESEDYARYRGKVLITPNAAEDLELLFSVDHSEAKRLFRPLVDADANDFESSNFTSINSISDNEQTVYAFNLTYSISDQLEFEGRAAFLDNRFDIPDTTPLFDFRQNTDTITSEALLRVRDFGLLDKGVFGVAFENQRDDATNEVAFFPLALDAEINNLGIFSELEFDLAEAGLPEGLTMIAGGRIEFDSRDRFLAFAGAGTDTTVEETAFIPKIGLRYDISNAVTVGYTYSEGFRPGGVDFDLFNPVGGVVEYDSERLRQHEIYTRTNFLDERLTVNASAFYYTFVDAQTSGAAAGTAGAIGLFGNVPEARGFGLELDAAFEIVDGLTMNGGIGLLDTEITDAGPNVPQFEGEDLPQAPNLTLNGGLSYISDLGFDASIKARYVDSKTVSLGFDESDSYVVVDLAAGYAFSLSDDFDLRIDAFVTNLTDERYVVDPNDGLTEVLGRPRTIGVAGTIRF
ncbi:TonB-dependent receptor domain-containing protein [Pelagibius sp.]|uniref:TonB-dependent receptor domain-containing protein n=1 Tax=Pelagibius sp. TaxID=1931238 RepID=UPI003BAE6FF4